MKDGDQQWIQIFYEDFKSYSVGPFSEGYTAEREVLLPPKKVFQGPWLEISSYHLWGPRFKPESPNWRIAESSNGNVLKQTNHNRLNQKNLKYFIKKVFFKSRLQPILAFPTLTAGDVLWSDYRLIAEVEPLSNMDLVGLLFRVCDGHNHYIFGLKKNKALLLKRLPNSLETIAKKRFPYSCNRSYVLSMTAIAGRIAFLVDGEPIFEIEDETFKKGKVGIMANVPALFHKVEVLTQPAAHDSWHSQKDKAVALTRDLRAQFPQMKVWKKIRIPGPCTGRFMRFAGLTATKEPGLLIATGNELPGGNNIACLTAMDLNGNQLWQRGQLPSESLGWYICADLPFQVHDIDGDGLNEVVCAMNSQIEILDARNGQLKLSAPTPKSAPGSKFDRITGDAVYICNLSGENGYRQFLLKDRHSKVWAFDNQLNLLWEYASKGEMGHFPFTSDIDNDGRDEILIGYSLLNADGKRLWELPLTDHADAVAIFKKPGSSEHLVLIAASDEGFIFADIDGKIKKHLRLGHMQTVTVARLIPGSPEYQVATNTYWGTPGMIYIIDLEGNVQRSFQPSISGSPICPVNWRGDGHELLLLSAAPDETGGLYDGLGRQAVEFPDDGHPTLCYDALDLDGDGIDELVCWDDSRLWIYKREDQPDPGTVKVPRRFPAYFNGSNYRSFISEQVNDK